VNEDGEFSVLKLATGKYDLIEREEIDERLKNLSYRMIKLVMIYIYLNNMYISIY
jgi:phage FluMu gp28-like protein